MTFNERHVFLAMIGRTRQLWAEHYLEWDLCPDERQEWEIYQWLHDQTHLYFADKFASCLDATPKSLEEALSKEYCAEVARALKDGKDVIGARVPVGNGLVCIPLMRARKDSPQLEGSHRAVQKGDEDRAFGVSHRQVWERRPLPLDVYCLRSAPVQSDQTGEWLRELASVKAGAVESFLEPFGFFIRSLMILTPRLHSADKPFHVLCDTADQDIEYNSEIFSVTGAALAEVEDPLVAPENGKYFAPFDNVFCSEAVRLKSASLLRNSSYTKVLECADGANFTLSGYLAERGLEAFLSGVNMPPPARCVFARSVEIHGLAIESDCTRTGVPLFISAAWLEGSQECTCDLTLEEIVLNDPKVNSVKNSIRSRILFIGEKTSLNAGYALLSDPDSPRPFTAFDQDGSLRLIPKVSIEAVYANPELMVANHNMEEAARLFRLPPPPDHADLSPGQLCEIAKAMLERRASPDEKALLNAAAAYCQWEAVTALRVVSQIHARHLLAVGPFKANLQPVPGFANWLAIKTERLDKTGLQPTTI